MGYTKIIQSGELTEIYDYEYDLNPKIYEKGIKKGRKVVKRVGEKKKDRNGNTISSVRRSDNINRLYKRFRRIVQSNLITTVYPAFVTLTMFEIVSISSAYVAFHDFGKRLRKVFGQVPSYIAVPEFQKRGAVHFHCLIWGLPDEYVDKNPVQAEGNVSEEDLKETSNRLLQNLWGRGFVDCISTDGSIKLATYLGKYMRKAMSDVRLSGQKAYTRSRNTLSPMSYGSSSVGLYFDEIVGVDNLPLHVRNFETRYLGKGRYSIYKNNRK